jgi:hypothetical protein
MIHDIKLKYIQPKKPYPVKGKVIPPIKIARPPAASLDTGARTKKRTKGIIDSIRNTSMIQKHTLAVRRKDAGERATARPPTYARKNLNIS